MKTMTERLVESVRTHAKTVLLPSVAEQIANDLEFDPIQDALHEYGNLVFILSEIEKYNGHIEKSGKRWYCELGNGRYAYGETLIEAMRKTVE